MCSHWLDLVNYSGAGVLRTEKLSDVDTKKTLKEKTHQCSVLVNGSIHNTLSATPIPSLSRAAASPINTEDKC